MNDQVGTEPTAWFPMDSSSSRTSAPPHLQPLAMRVSALSSMPSEQACVSKLDDCVYEEDHDSLAEDGNQCACSRFPSSRPRPIRESRPEKRRANRSLQVTGECAFQRLSCLRSETYTHARASRRSGRRLRKKKKNQQTQIQLANGIRNEIRIRCNRTRRQPGPTGEAGCPNFFERRNKVRRSSPCSSPCSAPGAVAGTRCCLRREF